MSSIASTAGGDVTSAACEFSSAAGGAGITASVGFSPFPTTGLVWFRVGSNVGDCDAGAGVGTPVGWATVIVWGV